MHNVDISYFNLHPVGGTLFDFGGNAINFGSKFDPNLHIEKM